MSFETAMSVNRYVHYGSDRYKGCIWKPVRNAFWTKPDGGLWASPVNSDHGWKWFCECENWNTEALRVSFEFSLTKGARILHLTPDLVRELSQFDRSLIYPVVCIDFEALKKDWDVLYYDPWESNHLERRLFGWDCESIVVMNKGVINDLL